MKKILFCAAIAALATACTNEDDFGLSQDNSRTQGLTFNVALAEGAATRGEIAENNGKYPFFWYAEKDRINVFAFNVVAGSGNTDELGTAAVNVNDGVWTPDADGAAEYKATQSAGAGLFTAVSDENMLELEADKEATIIATYKIAAKTITSTIKTGSPNTVVAGDVKELTLTTSADNAAQTVQRANHVEAPMYSISAANLGKPYHSLGERANLDLIRPFPLVKFTTMNTAKFIEDFGKLKTVELSALGTPSASTGGTATDQSALAFQTGKDFVVKGDNPGFGAGYEAVSNKNVVKVTLTDGTWTDDDAVYMTIAPVDRKTMRTNGKKELLKVVYEFDNITFTLDASSAEAKDFEKKLQTNADWTALTKDGQPNGVISVPALDINNYDYLVTDGTTKTLIVLNGNFKDAINPAGTQVVWGAGNVDITDIAKIVSEVELSDDELGMLKGFAGLKEISLAKNATIPAKTFDVLSALETIDMPMVTKIAPNAFVAQTALEVLNLPAYAFEDENVNKLFFNDNTKGTITTLDLSSVMSMIPDYGILRSLSFTGYTALKTVTLNSKEAIKLSSNIFKDCTNLETVKGTVILSDGAFDGCAKLATINVEGTVIPSNAFNSCAELTSVLVGKNQIAPTEVGESAFADAVKLEYMDLSNVTKLGESAFSGATKFVRSAKGAIDLKVGAAFIPTSAFESTAVELVEFTNATSIAPGIFTSCAALKQVRFVKTFDVADANIPVVGASIGATAWDGTFGTTPEAVDFFYADGQKYLNGVKLTLMFKNTDDSKKLTNSNAITFKGAYKK